MDRRDKSKQPRPDMTWSEKHQMWVDPDNRTPEEKARHEIIALEYEVRYLKEKEVAALAAFQKIIGGGVKVKHKADGALGTVLGISTNLIYDLDVLFENGVTPCYRRNLIPEWWP